tara:strand:+ start:112 stop:507 length:396 start_codon:yes stop_codon:yes gene_type:complete
MTMPLQKLIVFCRAFCLFLNPAKYATVTGKSDNEQGPKLVKRPPEKTNRRVKGVGLFRPLIIISSPLRVKSDKIKLIEEMFKKRFATLIYTPDYLFKSLFEEFLTKTSEDSTDDLTNKAAISRLAINEFPP